MPETKKKSRYPGIRAFESDERELFFGREQETLELFSMVKVRPLTVLFSKSGIGKTSLINAGLIPLLEEDGFFPIKIRLQDLSLPPVSIIKKILQPYLRSDYLEKNARHNAEDATLWEYLHACDFTLNGTERTPVLIFDQFEEFFNHAPQQQNELIGVLSDIVNERLPESLQEHFRSIPRRERTDEQLAWFTPVRARVVFSIRADRMSQLDDLKVQIPTVLHDRFHLRALQHHTAKAAIVEPALKDDPTFETPPFRYDPTVFDEMMEALSNKYQEVESFQLQLLCQHIEQQVKQRYSRNA
jgi:hypothetical protein